MSTHERDLANVEPDEERPWEKPGRVRRDCEPHRGPMLLFMAKASLACSLLSLCFWIPSLIGLPLAVLTYALAEHDRRRMEKGVLDPAGTWEITQAETVCFSSMLISGMMLVLAFILFLAIVVFPSVFD